MKKGLLSLVIVAGLATSASAQVLHDQLGTLDANGIISNQYTDASADTTIKCADDFIVPVGGTWNVDRVTVHGFRNDGGNAFTMVNMTVEIYDDASGAPGSMIYNGDFAVNIPEPQGDTALVFVIPTQTLTEGTYWVSVYGDAPSTSRWNWATISESYNGIANLIDPDDWFGAGATSWTAFNALGLTNTDLSFSIGGTASYVSVPEEEEVSIEVFPNPATDNITILTEGVNVQQATIYDATGKMIINHTNPSNTIDVSELPSGVYIIEITTENGIAQERFMKK